MADYPQIIVPADHIESVPRRVRATLVPGRSRTLRIPGLGKSEIMGFGYVDTPVWVG